MSPKILMVILCILLQNRENNHKEPDRGQSFRLINVLPILVNVIRFCHHYELVRDDIKSSGKSAIFN